MKNVIKKISAIAMALTLLGTGTAIIKKVDPKAANTLVACAACQYHDGSKLNGKTITNYDENKAKKTGAKYCKCCGKFTGWYNGLSDDGCRWQNGRKVPKDAPHPTPTPTRR